MAGAPVATYNGQVSGFPATRPGGGHRLNAHSRQATAYSSHLQSKQNSVLARAGVSDAKVAYHYTTVLNGVAARLTQAQAMKMQTMPGVVSVWKSRIVTVQSDPTKDFLGLTGNKGVWQRQFGGDANAGNGVVIADIDTGFWPESPSWASLPEPRSDDSTIADKFHGTCDPGINNRAFAPVTCNNKVIGARFFDAAGLSNRNPGEFKSPRDFDGHGDHTASTAAGELVKNISVNGIGGLGDAEGVAPGARVAVYKVLYEAADDSTSQGSDVDIVAAINQAVADGVDVINFSVGDNIDAFGPDELAFLNASAAGVFVSAAAGNAGPGASTVDNAMPWETTDAAGTFDQAFTKTLTLGSGAIFTGIGVGPAVPSSPLIDSVNAGLPGKDGTLCVSGTLDPAKVTGKIVLCQRGSNARLDKSLAVKEAGGVGMILWNPSPNSLDADFHAVPSIAVDTPTGQAVKTYIAGTANPTASLSAGVATKVEAPDVAGFSSRGPSPSSGGDLLKPDIMAPGVSVIAAVAPPNHNGNLYDVESGTSMATPHIAGVAALLKSKHPDWSPMEIKSAMMTTASTTTNAGNPIAGTPFDFGSGEVSPAAAFDPGLVYDSSEVDWLQYLCGIGVALLFSDGSTTCDRFGAIDPSDLNYPTIAIGALTGSQTVTRTVTNVSGKPGNYKVDVSAPAGLNVSVSTKHFVIQPGQEKTYTVTITRTTAALNAYAFGSLTWTDQRGHSVRSAIAVKPVALAAPGSVSGTGTSGSTTVSLQTGYNGTLTATAQGLVNSTITPLSLTGVPNSNFNPNAPATSARTGRVDTVVAPGTKVAKFSTFASDYPAGTDVDIYLYRVNGANLVPVATSAGSTPGENITLTDPAAGTYALFVDLFATPGNGTETLTVKPNTWVLPPTNAGNFTASPASQSVVSGGTPSVTLNWTGLSAGGHWLGRVEYGDGTNVIGSTLVSVDS
jgi:subtilisin family serine protease